MGKDDAEIVRLEGVTKDHAGVKALADVTFGCPKGGFTAVIGPPGAGKSTLLRCAAGLDRPTSGRVVLDGVDLTEVDEAALTRLRRDHVSFLFSSHNLLPALNVGENLTLPLRLAGRSAPPERVVGLIRRAGLSEHLDRMPAQLSSSKRQLVAITRALISRPTVIFADDPARGLDPRGAGEVLGLLADFVREMSGNVVLASHDPMAAAYADHTVLLHAGRVVRNLALPVTRGAVERAAHLATWEARDLF